MSWSINPALYCAVPGCRRPKRPGEAKCADCWRLERFAGSLGVDIDSDLEEPERARAPRCIVYLSHARDVITIELTGEPRFSEADVERIAWAMSNRRRAS